MMLKKGLRQKPTGPPRPYFDALTLTMKLMVLLLESSSYLEVTSCPKLCDRHTLCQALF